MNRQSNDDLDGRPSEEIGDEGGGSGDVEIDQDSIGAGREANETWQVVETERRDIARDETGRKSPITYFVFV